MSYMDNDVSIFLRFVVIFQNFLSFLYSVLRVQDRYETSRPIHLSAPRVGGRDHDFEPCISVHACKSPKDMGWDDKSQNKPVLQNIFIVTGKRETHARTISTAYSTF